MKFDTGILVKIKEVKKYKKIKYLDFSGVSNREQYWFNLAVIASSESDFKNKITLFLSAMTLHKGEVTIGIDDYLDRYEISKMFKIETFYDAKIGNQYDDDIIKIFNNVIEEPKYKTSILKYSLAKERINLSSYNFNNNLEYEEIQQYINEDYFKMKLLNNIVVLYSILEELGIEVRASRDKPSIVNGEWNNEVRSDLKDRLNKLGLNEEKEIDWLNRSDNERPFKKNIKKDKLCDYSDGKGIKDFKIKYIDAILEISYFRNKNAAHAIYNKIDVLDISDLQNTYYLIQSILLDIFVK